jgi:hypothetical protein
MQTNLTNNVTDSRRSPRRTFQRPIGLLVQGEYTLAEAAQISEGGMLILSEYELALKDLIVVTLLLPDGGHAVARAEILYRRKPTEPGGPAAFGLQFLNLPLMKRRIIRNYVAAKTQEEAEIDQQQEISTAAKKR